MLRGFRLSCFEEYEAIRFRAWRVSDFGCRLDLVGFWVLGFRGFGFFILSCLEEYEAIRFRAWRVSDFGCRLSDLVGFWVLGFWVF